MAMPESVYITIQTKLAPIVFEGRPPSCVTQPAPSAGGLAPSHAPVRPPGAGCWSRYDTGPRTTLPALLSVGGATLPDSDDPANRMNAAIQKAGGALLVLCGPNGAAWAVPQGGGRLLWFSHATGNRLIVGRLIKRHPLDCRDLKIARYIPSHETPLTDKETDALISEESNLQRALERKRLKAQNSRDREGRNRFERKALIGIDREQLHHERYMRNREYNRLAYHRKKAASALVAPV